MSKFFNGLLLGIILGVGGFWFLQERAQKNPDAEKRFQDSAAQARDSAAAAASHLSDALKAQLEVLNLRPEDIKDELARAGKIVRRKAQDLGDRAADAAADAKVVAAIKAKYALDPDLSVLQISVACDVGHVTLSGTVASPEALGKAVALALETDGVRDATSTLAIKPGK